MSVWLSASLFSMIVIQTGIPLVSSNNRMFSKLPSTPCNGTPASVVVNGLVAGQSLSVKLWVPRLNPRPVFSVNVSFTPSASSSWIPQSFSRSSIV